LPSCDALLALAHCEEGVEDRTGWSVNGSVLDRQSLEGVDVAKATALLARLGWDEEITTDIVIAYARAGSDDSALGLLNACPRRPRNGARIAAHALLTGCDRTLAGLIGPTKGTSGEGFARAAALEAATVLKCAGQPKAALCLERLGGECEDDRSVQEGDEAGRRFAEKLWAAAGLPEPRGMIARRAVLSDARW
jgi:hypothetical protein